MQTSRRLASRLILSLLGIAAVPAALAQPALEKAKLVLAVGGKPSLYYLALTIAEREGFFKSEGLDVEINDFAGGSKALQALVGGSADVVAGAYDHTIAMQARGQSIQAFVLMDRAPQLVLGVATAKAAGYKSAKDLKGLSIGVSAPGSLTQALVNYELAKVGLKPSDVSIIGVGASSGAVAALRGGKIDALSNPEPTISMLELSKDIVAVADTRSVKGTAEVFGGPVPSGCLYASTEFIRKHPNTTQALTNAMLKSLRWIQQATPEQVAAAVPEGYLLGDKAMYISAFKAVRGSYSPDGLFSEDGARNMAKVLASFNDSVKPEAIKLDATYTNAFVLRAPKP